MTDSERYWRLMQAAFNCGQMAFSARNEDAHRKAAELHRKYAHKWEQAISREKSAA